MSKGVVRKIIKTDTVPPPVGPYNQAVICDNIMYVSGQLGVDVKTNDFASDNVEDQANQALINIGGILSAAGISYNNVVKVTVLLTNMNDFTKVNDIYKKFFKANYPARVAYQVSKLPKGAKVEMDAIAITSDIIDSDTIKSKL